MILNLRRFLLRTPPARTPTEFPVKTTGILEVLEAVSPFIKGKVECHLLGIARVDFSKQFRNLARISKGDC